VQTDRGILIEFTVAAEFFKTAADLNGSGEANFFASCLNQGRGVETNIDQTASYVRRSSLFCHVDGVDNFRRCLVCPKGIDKNLLCAAK
jgi:TPR repeat protein